jgi:hypothetical protein
VAPNHKDNSPNGSPKGSSKSSPKGSSKSKPKIVKGLTDDSKNMPKYKYDNDKWLEDFFEDSKWKIIKTKINGDCFFDSISKALDKTSVEALRFIIKESFTIDKWNHFNITAEWGIVLYSLLMRQEKLRVKTPQNVFIKKFQYFLYKRSSKKKNQFLYYYK